MANKNANKSLIEALKVYCAITMSNRPLFYFHTQESERSGATIKPMFEIGY